jgi:uncharacterized membrane protein
MEAPWLNSRLIAEFGNDAVAVTISLALVGFYYWLFRKRTRRDPNSSIIAVNSLARRLWVDGVMRGEGKEIVAVQSLRNFLMVGIMMASTASVLVIGTLTLSGQADNITRSWHVLAFLGSHAPELWIVKVMCLLADFLTAFFAFAMSIRLANQVLFMINVPESLREGAPQFSPERVSDRLNSAGHMVAVGMRAYLFSIPLVFWLFGPVFLVLATIGLVLVLDRIDSHQQDG